jgi:hypothetical protein
VESDKSEGPVAAGDRVGYIVDGCCPGPPNVSENQTSSENQSLPGYVLNSPKKLPRS